MKNPFSKLVLLIFITSLGLNIVEAQDVVVPIIEIKSEKPQKFLDDDALFKTEKVNKRKLEDSNGYVHIDETRGKILSTNTNGYIWAMGNCYGAYFQYETTRSGEVALEMLGSFKMVLWPSRDLLHSNIELPVKRSRRMTYIHLAPVQGKVSFQASKSLQNIS